MNNVVLIGRLTKDPELRYLTSGDNVAVTRFIIAVDRGYSREKAAEAKAKDRPTADFINITVWGRQAENVANYVIKGQLVAVEGRIQTGSYEAKDGTRRYTTEVVAHRVEFLEWNKPKDSEEDLEELEGFYEANGVDIPF